MGRHNGCDGKIGYRTARRAKYAMRQMLKTSSMNGSLNVYRCRICRKWHIGRLEAYYAMEQNMGEPHAPKHRSKSWFEDDREY